MITYRRFQGHEKKYIYIQMDVFQAAKNFIQAHFNY